jgi:hypothetical protein
MKAYLPWPLKIAAKLVLSRLGISYTFWRAVSLFKHGQMLDAGYAKAVFDRHTKYATGEGGNLLEIGPGDSVMTALVAYAHFTHVTLVDSKVFAAQSAEPYLAAARELAAAGERVPALDAVTSFEALLTTLRCDYRTHGLASLRALPPDSIDFSFSHAVFEHLPLGEVEAFCSELYRVTRPGSKSSHVIDFEDHFCQSLNNLRFTEQTWESSLFAKSGFYTNRLRLGHILKALTDAGFAVDTLEQYKWDALPVSRARLDPKFRDLPESDLLTRGAHVVLRKPV